MRAGNLAILGHLVFESMASISFFFQPKTQLQDSKASEEAILICHSYAGLLLATDVLCLLSLARNSTETFDDTSAMVARSMAIYHIFPMRRAWARMKERRGNYRSEEQMAGGPPGHLVIHGILFVALVWAGWRGKQ